MFSEFAVNRVPSPPAAKPGGRGRAKSVEVAEIVRANLEPWLEEVLLHLYDSHYSTISRIKGTGKLSDAVQAFLIRERGVVSSALIFRRQGRQVHVLNEVAHIPAAEILRFASHVFTYWGGIDVIRFKAIRTDLQQSRYPMQKYDFSEDFVLPLARNPQDYFESLGPSTRKTIRGYTNKIKRDFPTFVHRVCEGEHIKPEDIRGILALSRARMTANGKHWGISDAECDSMIALARDYGQVVIFTIDGRICAGSISYRARDNFFMRVCAHDALYDRYRLGTLSQYRAITACIEAGAKECHLLWGRQPYKYSLGALPVPLENVTLYRSRIQEALNAPLVLKNLAASMYRRVKLMRAERKATEPVERAL